MQSLSIKSTKSASLPIWSCKLGTGEGARWHGFDLQDGVQEDDESETMSVEIPCAAKNKKAILDPGERAGGSLGPSYAD